jgi:hypothetical protein
MNDAVAKIHDAPGFRDARGGGRVKTHQPVEGLAYDFKLALHGPSEEAVGGVVRKRLAGCVAENAFARLPDIKQQPFRLDRHREAGGCSESFRADRDYGRNGP